MCVFICAHSCNISEEAKKFKMQIILKTGLHQLITPELLRTSLKSDRRSVWNNINNYRQLVLGESSKAKANAGGGKKNKKEIK